MTGITDATRTWQVSERTLRRRLANRRIGGAERDEHGQWLIPTEWLDAEFERIDEPEPDTPETTQVIDLRDTTVADGLAQTLSGLIDWTDRIVDAEVRAATASNELESVSTNLRRTTNDLESQRAERARLEADLADTTSALTLETDRRERAEERADRAEKQLTQYRIKRRKQETALRQQVQQQQTTLTALETIVGRRGRRKLKRFLDDKS